MSLRSSHSQSREKKDLCVEHPQAIVVRGGRGGGGTTGNLPLVFIANQRSKVIDVTFTLLLLLPLGRCTSNPAHTNKLQSAADAQERRGGKKRKDDTECGG